MVAPSPAWARAARWLSGVAVALLALALLLAGLAARAAYLESTCVDPPEGGRGFGCAWGHGLARFIETVGAAVLALAAGASALLASVARSAASGDARARVRAVRLAVASAAVGLASLALHLDGSGPCLQCPLWQDPSTQAVLAGLELAWRAVVSVALATALASAGMARRLRATGLETVK